MHALTIYRTNDPESKGPRNSSHDFYEVEYYELVMDEETYQDGVLHPRLRIFHGYWNQAENKAIANAPILTKRFDNWQDAGAEFDRHLAHYADSGFRYAFSPTPSGPHVTSI